MLRNVFRIFLLASILFLTIIYLFNKDVKLIKYPKFPNYKPQLPEIIWAYRQDLFETGDWQEILKSGDEPSDAPKFFVYSAYLDSYKSEPIIKVIAVTRSYSTQPLFCYLFDAELHPLGVVRGVVKTTFWVAPHVPYSPGFILCKKLQSSSSFPPQLRYVAISPVLSAPILSKTPIMLSNLLPIINSNQSHERKEEPHEFGMCVQPIFNFNKVLNFIQFIEFYRMMGVTHFTFYNISISPNVSCVIRHYVESNETEIQVFQWNHPLPNDTQWDVVQNNAQVAQINDCILRNRGVARYIVGVDLDEFILPAEGISDFHQLIGTIDKGRGEDAHPAAQYQFRQRFFGTECSISKSDPYSLTQEGVVLEDLLLYRHVQATSKLTPHGDRSKYICVPKLIVETGVHLMSEGVGSAEEVKVGENLAYIRHCRQVCPQTGECSGSGPLEVDMLGHHYAPRLLPRVAQIVEKVVGESTPCNLDLRGMRKTCSTN